MAYAHTDLDDGVSSLANRSWIALGFVFAPTLFTLGFFAVHSLETGMSRESYGLPEAFFLYGLANVLVVGLLYRRADPRTRSAIFRFRRPSPRELAWTAIAFAAGLAVYPITAWISTGLGLQPVEIPYSLANPPILVMVLLGVVVIAPVAEEILFRGLLLGTVLSREVGVASAVVVTTVASALCYLLAFGAVGLLFVGLWGLLPALLRVRFDSLTGAVLLHAANNLVASFVLVGL